MKKLSFRKRLSCSVVAMLSLFAVCGNNLHAEEITYYRGAIDGPPEVQTVAGGSTITVSNMGINAPGYVILGWHELKVPMIVNSMAVENALMGMALFHPVGSSLTVTGDMDLHAIWAIDKNGDGYPDYGGGTIRPRPQYNKELIQRMISEVDFYGEDVSLRSAPAWDYGYDIPAFDDSIYYVGCIYNQDPANQIWENLIYMNPKFCFNNMATVAKKKMNLVIEYGGVLEDGCMIGGSKFKSLKTIEITQDMVANKDTLISLLNDHPFMFNAIKEDGQGVLKMWFEIADETDVNYGKMPDVTSGTYFGSPATGVIWGGGAWGLLPGSKGNEAFWNPETNAPDSVLTIKFNIYNKPAFKSPVISQRVDTAGRIDLKLVSGTPVKYMMRCINDFRWRPADSPLTNAERNEIWNQGARICFREMDKTIGHQMFLKAFYFTDEFPPDGNMATNPYYQDFLNFRNEKQYAYDDSTLVYYRNNEPGSLGAMPPLTSTGYAAVEWWYSALSGTPLPATPLAIGTPAADLHYGFLSAALGAAQSMAQLTSPYPGISAVLAIAQARATADWYTVYAPRKAAAIPVPDACRETFCLEFESKGYPTIEREVFIPQVDGVTTNPEYGTHYVYSQDDFNFTAKYAAAQPMKVTTNRIINGVEEVLPGTLNEKGEYEYVIHKVTQNIQLTFSPGSVDNASIDGIAVWSYNNTINIRVAKEDVASIYSIAGQMVKRVELSDGDNPIPMERGVYIVTLKDGAVHKVTVK